MKKVRRQLYKYNEALDDVTRQIEKTTYSTAVVNERDVEQAGVPIQLSPKASQRMLSRIPLTAFRIPRKSVLYHISPRGSSRKISKISAITGRSTCKGRE